MLNINNSIDLKNLVSLINDSETILIASHIMPDGDNIGAIASLGLALKKLNKVVTTSNLDPVPRIYKFFPDSESIIPLGPITKVHDLFILVDCSDETRMGIDNYMDLGKTVVNFDHHAGNTMFANVNIVEPDISSTCEMVYYLINALDVEIDKDMAISIFTGMMTDTIRFLTNSCNPRFYQIIADLVSKGVDPAMVGTNIYMNNTENSTRLLGDLLEEFKLSDDKKLSYSLITEELKTKHNITKEDIPSIVNHILSVNTVETALTFEFDKDIIHLSMRSKTDFDVGKIARELGGGGHLNAAGTAISGTSEDCNKIISMVKDRMKKHFAQN